MPEVRVASVADFEQTERVLTSVGDREVVVFRIRGSYVAYENRCPHLGGPIGLGRLMPRVEAVLDENRAVTEERFSQTQVMVNCPWHAYEFDVSTGACVVDPRYRLNKYEVIENDGELYVVA